MSWTVRSYLHVVSPSFAVVDEAGAFVARVHPLNGTPEDIEAARKRAHLMAAAPELLAALEALIAAPSQAPNAVFHAAKAAIAAAKGVP